MRTIASLLVVASAVAAPLQAQSLFNSAGLGLPVEALDGRARALGSLGIGLRGAAFMPTDPAALASLFLPTGIMVSQPSWVDYAQDGGSSGSFRGTRFPLMGIAYPLFSGMMSVQIGSFLDQRFATEVPGSVDLLGVPTAITDRFEQDGSVSNLNIGFARTLGARVSVGATVGRYAGSTVRTLTRTYAESDLEVQGFLERGKWSYAGYSVTAGVASDLSAIVHVAASVQIPTALDANAAEGTEGANGSFDLPMQFRVGASAQLAPGLMISGSAAMVDWSGVESDLAPGNVVGNSNGFGVGVELARTRLLGRDAPLRFGYRRTGLPFSFGGDASERIYSGGLGLALNRTSDVLLAGADFGLERGLRSGGGVEERFWRLTISIVLSGS